MKYNIDLTRTISDAIDRYFLFNHREHPNRALIYLLGNGASPTLISTSREIKPEYII